MRVPKQFNPKEPASRRNLGAAFRSKLAEIDLNPQRHRSGRISEEIAEQIDDLRDRLRRHPCHTCPDREAHARYAERALRLERENERAQQRVSSRTNTIATHFDKICTVLGSLGLPRRARPATRSRRRAGCWPGSTPSSIWWRRSASGRACSTT